MYYIISDVCVFGLLHTNCSNTWSAWSINSELIANYIIGHINANIACDGVLVEIGGQFAFFNVIRSDAFLVEGSIRHKYTAD